MWQNGHLMKVVLRGLAGPGVWRSGPRVRSTRRSPQPDSGAGREARPGRRDQGPRAPARHARAASRRSGRDAGRLGARQLRPRPARRPPLRQRLARLPLPARRQQPAARVRERRARLSRSPIYNRLESGFIGFDFHPEFAQNGLFYTVHAERATGNPATPNFIPPGFTPKRRDLPQRHHGVARHEPGGEHVRGHPARAAPRGPRRRRTSPTRWAPSSSTRRRSPARPTTACSTRAAAISGSATAADRTRTIPARRSGSTRSSRRSCGSIRAVPR